MNGNMSKASDEMIRNSAQRTAGFDFMATRRWL